jgi:hypothetical protein
MFASTSGDAAPRTLASALEPLAILCATSADGVRRRAGDT